MVYNNKTKTYFDADELGDYSKKYYGLENGDIVEIARDEDMESPFVSGAAVGYVCEARNSYAIDEAYARVYDDLSIRPNQLSELGERLFWTLENDVQVHQEENGNWIASIPSLNESHMMDAEAMKECVDKGYFTDPYDASAWLSEIESMHLDYSILGGICKQNFADALKYCKEHDIDYSDLFLMREVDEYLFVVPEDLYALETGNKLSSLTDEQKKAILDNAEEKYNDYASRDVFCYTIHDKNGNAKDTTYDIYGIDAIDAVVEDAAKNFGSAIKTDYDCHCNIKDCMAEITKEQNKEADER